MLEDAVKVLGRDVRVYPASRKRELPVFQRMRASWFISNCLLQWEPRCNEGPTEWENWFVKSRVRCIEVLFQTFYCNFGRAEEYRSLYRGLRYIEVPLYWNRGNEI